MLKYVAVSFAAVGFFNFALPAIAFGADLVAAPAVQAPNNYVSDDATARTETLRAALSEYLNLLMIRVTFDVVDRADLASELTDKLRVWGGRAPSAGAKADLDRQLLAEGSYYLISLSYTVKVGGAAFPGDKAEMVYANDTIVELDGLQRKLADTVTEGGDTLPILVRAEEIRALTEGNTEVSPDIGVFKDHAAILDKVVETAARGTQT